MRTDYIIPSDNREQQRQQHRPPRGLNYIIPSDNREQQPAIFTNLIAQIISYQAITGNNNSGINLGIKVVIISYQAITGNNNQ